MELDLRSTGLGANAKTLIWPRSENTRLRKTQGRKFRTRSTTHSRRNTSHSFNILWSVFLVFNSLVSLSVSSARYDVVNTTVDVFEIDCRQHAGPCNFRSHGCARFQRQCNVADCDPLFFVNCFCQLLRSQRHSHFGRCLFCYYSIATYCFPVLCVLHFLDCALSLTLSPGSLLIVLHSRSHQICPTGYAVFFSHHQCSVFCFRPIFA